LRSYRLSWRISRAGSAEAGLKYLLLGAVAAAFIAFGIALIYAALGTLAITPALQGVLREGTANPVALAGWGLLLSGLAFKVSLVPAHLWTPDVYQGGSTPVIAFLSTGSKAAAFAALFLLLPAPGGVGILRTPLWWMAFLSMLVGNLAALRQENIKRMLAYSSIAQMGYVTLAFLTGSADGHMAALFYLVAYSAMNLAAFGAIASLAPAEGLETIDDYRGIGYDRPFQAGVLALAMFALAGIPPTAGFTGKFMIFAAVVRGGELPLAITGILTAAVSIYFYLRVVVSLYLRPAGAPVTASRATPAEGLALGVVGLAILILGIFPSPLLDLIYDILR
jgi:NADH-quinone oxidoreductase subunit N